MTAPDERIRAVLRASYDRSVATIRALRQVGIERRTFRVNDAEPAANPLFYETDAVRGRPIAEGNDGAIEQLVLRPLHVEGASE